MMRMSRPRRRLAWVLSLFLFPFAVGLAAAAEKTIYDCDAPENREVQTTIDLKLAKKYKTQKKEIKARVMALDERLKVRLGFFPFLDPPMNLGIGKCVSAENGRQAIEVAKTFNRGIGLVVMQEILPHHWVRIGLTDLPELAWIPVGPEDLARLSDPSLSTDEFQSVYRELATLKERKLPFGMGTKKIDPEPEE